MRAALRSVCLAVAFAGFAVAPAAAQELPPVPQQKWSFGGVFGSYDTAALQRGWQVYSEVCSNCHSMHYVHYRDLEGIGLTPAQVKAVAAGFTVPQGTDDQGNPKEGPATPADQLRSPFPNDKAARAANNGALPPDMSLLANSLEGHANRIYAILNGYTDPPPGFKLQEGMNYNEYFPGHQIAMPQPLHDDQVTYADGTKATIPQMAHDVATFLTWASNPEMVQRKQIGIRVVLFLVLLGGLTYAVKRKLWSDVH
jgi:ubiquinol-cytochrome c reductase cytochrome c1 subunit